MKSVRVVLLPMMLTADDLNGRAVVVFDVLRATTTMTAALSSGAAAVRVFGSIEDARGAHAAFDGNKLLAGEIATLRPEGFDLGNSPGEFTFDKCGGRTIFMSTTNGTRALVAAKSAPTLLTGAIVNAAAVGRALSNQPLPVTLLCSGTDGKPAYDDLIGCGAVLANITDAEPDNDAALMAEACWQNAKDDLQAALASGLSGHHLTHAKLAGDFEFAAHYNRVPVVGRVKEIDGALVVTRQAT